MATKTTKKLTKAEQDAADAKLAKETAAKVGAPLPGASQPAPQVTSGGLVSPDLRFTDITSGTGTSNQEDPIDALLNTIGLYGIRTETVDITGVGPSTAWTGVSAGSNRKIVTVRQAVAQLDYLSAAEFAKLQTSLYEAGFYSSTYYKPGAKAPAGDRYTDDGFLNAYAQAITTSFQARGKEKFSDVLAKRTESNRQLFIDKAKAEADDLTATAKSAKNQAEAEAAQREAEIKRAQAADLEARTPSKIVQTRSLELPSLASLGSEINAKAQQLLGRDATEAERKAIGESIRTQLRDRGLQSADLAQFNLDLGDPVAGSGAVPGATVDTLATGQTTAGAVSGSAFPTGPIPEGIPGYGQLTNKKANPYAVATFVAMHQKYGASFLGIVGDEAHQKKKSDHNTWDAVDLGFKSMDVGQSMANDVVANAAANNVKYVIVGKKIWTPAKGWHDYTGDPHNAHVHVSFKRGKAPAVAAAGQAAAATTQGAGKTVAAASGAVVDIGTLADQVAQAESGNTNVPTKAAGSTASGYFQITDPTWGKYKGYARAIDAPREIQRERAMAVLSSNLKKFGTLELALAAYYAGSGNSKAKLQSLIDGDASPTAGTKTANLGMKTWLNKVLGTKAPTVAAGGTTSTPPTPVAVGSTDRAAANAAGMTPYQGAVTTGNGANVLVSDQIDPGQIIEDELKRLNPVGTQVQAATGFYDVYRQLFGGR